MTLLSPLLIRLLFACAVWPIVALTASAQTPTLFADQVLQGPANGLAAHWGVSIEVQGDRFIAGSNRDGAQIYKRDSLGAWALEQTFSSAGDLGFGVALDGTTACIGTRSIFPSGEGFAKALEYNGQAWTESPQFTASDGHTGNRFGADMSISADWMVIGAPGDDAGGNRAGAVYLYQRVAGAWNESAKLMASAPAADHYFGGSVVLSGDTLICGRRRVGGEPYLITLPGPGGVEIFQRTGNNWQLAQTISSPDTSAFGSSIAYDGTRLALGAPNESLRGAVHIYARQNGVWSLEQSIPNPNPNSFNFGEAVTIQGNRFATNAFTNFAGETLVYEFHNSSWQPVVAYTSNVPGELFGSALSLDNNDLLIGYSNAWLQSFFDDNGGFVPVEISVAPNSYCSAKLNSDGCFSEISSNGLPSATAPVSFNITSSNSRPFAPGILFYALTSGADMPFMGGSLCIAPPLRRTAPIGAGGDGSPCSGGYDFDFQERINSGVDPALIGGAEVWAQYWYRDNADPFGVGLTDGLAFTIWP